MMMTMLVLMMDVQLTLVIMKDVKPLMLTVMITMLVQLILVTLKRVVNTNKLIAAIMMLVL